MLKLKELSLFTTLLIAAVCLSGNSVLGINPEKDCRIPGRTNVPQKYSTFSSFDEMISAGDINYLKPFRISPVGSKKKPLYHGFFYYNHTPAECLQFEPTGRTLLAMRIFVEGRKVQPTDKGEIGMFDLRKNNKWIKIGETTAWNWQQGCRLQ